jgi:hypothetical protein
LKCIPLFLAARDALTLSSRGGRGSGGSVAQGVSGKWTKVTIFEALIFFVTSRATRRWEHLGGAFSAGSVFSESRHSSGERIFMSRHRKSTPPTTRFHGFESLESRQMLAGNLTAHVTGDTLFINEKPGSIGLDQSVQVSRAPSGQIRVEGLFNKSGGQTLIDGFTSRDLPPAAKLVIGTGGGNDQIQVRNASFTNVQILAGDPSGTSLADDDEVVVANVTTNRTGTATATGVLDIRTGGGRDTVFVQLSTIGGDLKIDTGVTGNVGAFDTDFVQIQDTTTRSATLISTGTSGDLVRIVDSKLGDDRNDFLQIHTGAGADTVDLVPNRGFDTVAGNIVIQAFESLSETDVDTVRAQQLNCGSMLVQLGGGNDVVNMLGVTSVSGIGTNSTFQLEGGAGNDKFTLSDIEILDNFFALMGDGSDTLDMTFVKANKSMKLDGGAGPGIDHLEKHQMPFIPSLTQTGWEFINGLSMTVKFPSGGVLQTQRV